MHGSFLVNPGGAYSYAENSIDCFPTTSDNNYYMSEIRVDLRIAAL